MIHVEFYGVLAQVAGSPARDYPLEQPRSLTDVLNRLTADIPALAAHLPTTACAVDDEIVPRNATIRPGARLALLPPVSGGRGRGRGR